MVKCILLDFSRVILFYKDVSYGNGLSDKHNELREDQSNYKFTDYFELNIKLLKFIKKLKNKYQISMFTNSILHKMPAVQKQLNPLIDIVYEAKILQLDKTSPSAYEFIAKEEKCKPSEILLLNDKDDELLAAKEAGLKFVQFLNTDQAIRDIQNQLK